MVSKLNVLRVPMGDYFTRNRHAESTLIKLAKLRDAYVVQGSKIDLQVAQLVKQAQLYAHRLMVASKTAKSTALKASKVSALWTRIATGVRVSKLRAKGKVIVGKNGHGRPPKNLPKGKINLKLKATGKKAKKPTIVGQRCHGLSKENQKKCLAELAKKTASKAVKLMKKAEKKTKKQVLRRLQRVRNYANASAGLDINAPVRDMKRRHAAYRNSLSGVVVGIQRAFDGAKANNTRAHKLRNDENDSLRNVQAAQIAVRGQRKKSKGIRRDKAANFPPLPKHVSAHFRSIK